MNAKGEFEVKLNPLETHTKGEAGVKFGRLSIAKKFQGTLIAESHGEMLSVMTNIKGSAGYVAVEQVVGTLGNKKGTFALQHFATMSSGKDRLILEVVPDSGTGELLGLSGKIEINIEGGKHFYTFDYDLKPPAESK